MATIVPWHNSSHLLNGTSEVAAFVGAGDASELGTRVFEPGKMLSLQMADSIGEGDPIFELKRILKKLNIEQPPAPQTEDPYTQQIADLMSEILQDYSSDEEDSDEE